MRDHLTFKAMRGLAGLAALKSGWQRLQALDSSTKYYQSYEWYACMAESLLADDDELLFIAVESENRLLGICPLQTARRVHCGLPITCLQFPVHSHAVLRDFLVHPSLYGVGLFSQLVEFLNKRAGITWDLLQLEGSPLGSCSDRLATERKISLGRSAISGSIAEIHCGATGESPLSHLSGHFRRNLARIERRAARLGDLSFVPYTKDENMQEGLRLFVEIENDNWKGDVGSSIASAAELRRFYSSISQQFTGDSRCQINLLRIGSESVAAQFGIVSNGTYFILKIGYRKRHAELGPGNLLLASTIRHFSEGREVHTVNLVTSPEWAEKWKTHAIPVCTHTVVRKSAKGLLLYVIMQCIAWLHGKWPGKGAT